ncbi:MAG: SsrA-binding protein SmpB [Candidatus Peregrinibacteria bacterium]
MKVVADNRRARFDYEITETLEAGLMLTGSEVKSCRMGHISLSGAYVSFLNGIPILKHVTISAYRYALPTAHDPERDRPLLLKKTQLTKLQEIAEQKGMTVIPLEIHAGKFIKVLLGVGRGRKRIDKRQRIKEREIGRKLREGGAY